MVGDRSHDVLGARKNGVAAVGVLWGYGSRTELTNAGAGALLASPYELAAALTDAAKGRASGASPCAAKRSFASSPR
jgi:phosphoglycolate phosphatase